MSYELVARNIDPDADNQIHDDDVAQRYGFTGALVPGVELFAYCTSPLVAAWGVAWLSGGRLAVRFRRPVHDGETVTLSVEESRDGTHGLELAGPDGTTRTVATAEPPAPQQVPDLARYPTAPLPDVPQAAPRLGSFGTVEQVAEPAACTAYLDAVAEPVPLYRDAGLVHPGLLLRLVNAALMDNVALGPWIHTASDCRFLGVARVGEHLAVRSVVTEMFERSGHSYVRYDALVLADERPVAEVRHEAIWRLHEQ
jgi:acyl dehydratase